MLCTEHRKRPERPVLPDCVKTFLFFYLCLFPHVPCEGDGIVGNFLHVPDGAEALLVVSFKQYKDS